MKERCHDAGWDRTAGRLSAHVAGAASVAAATALAAALVPAPSAAQSPSASPAPAGLDLFMPRPAEASGAPEVVALGRSLFFDPVLSRDSSLACASCHRPDRAFTDGRTVSVGVDGRRGGRNVPTIVNRGWGRTFFWDGRIGTLEEQVLQPIVAPVEMDASIELVVERIDRHPAYRDRFQRVFGGVGRSGLAVALAAYVRSIRAGDSRFDRVMDGDPSALNDQERRGLELFQGPARCARCHFGALLTDESFHNTGVAWRDGPPADSGRALVTGRPEDVGAFKTPTLREVSRTAPYMHDGSLATLEEVVDFYDQGGRANPYLDGRIRPLDLGEEDRAALVAFLRTLEGRIVEGGGVRR